MPQSTDISIVPFKYKYLPLLHEMLKSQSYLGISEINMKTLPKIGYIALLNDQPIAAGFLRKVEGGYAQIDGLTSNAYFGSQIRHLGIDGVLNTLVAEAKTLRLHGLICFCAEPSSLKRAEDLGFQVVSHTLLGLKL